MPLRPACSFARRAALGRCLSPPSLRPRAPGVRLALAPGAPGVCPPPPPHRRVRDASLGGWGLSPLPPTRCPLAGSARPQAAQWGGGSPHGRGAHRRHPWVPLVPSGTAVPYSPVRQRARSARWVSVCLAHPRLSPPLVCLRPALPCARVLWCEAYGMWLLAPILWPHVHHLKGGVPPAVRYCGFRIEVRAVVQRRAPGSSFCRAPPPVRRRRWVALRLGALRPVASRFLRCLLRPLPLRPSLLPIRPESL